MNKYSELYSKYLNQLKIEITDYKDENNLWLLTGDLKNTPANLALHLAGNLKHNFGAVIGGNGYVRNRDLEFSAKGVPREKIIEEIDSAIAEVIPVLDKITAEDLNKPFADTSHGEGQTIGSMMVRLSFHFSYHLGQINYHRRILDAK